MSKVPITMPVLSDTMESGQLANWLKKPGDLVKKGDVLAEVESDKAIMDVEAFSDGYLAGPLAKVGSEIPVGQIIGYITDSPDKTDAKREPPVSIGPSANKKDIPSETVTPKPTVTSAPVHATARFDDNTEVKISPYARGLAQELGIDPTTINPDPEGVIHAPQVIAAALQGPQPNLDAGPEWHYKLLSPMRRAIAANMSATLNTPTFRVSAELPLAALRQAAKTCQLSLTLLLARALALSVQENPLFNDVYTTAGLVTRKQINVGIAADIPGGLITPVIEDAARRPTGELAEDWRILKTKLAKQQLIPDDYEGATIYLSNLGMFDVVESFEAIVPLGATAILSVGAEKKGFASFVLSCDHRVVYGAEAARFMQTFKQLINKPGDWLKC